ncbi:MAG TPA: glycosyltransferase family A protein [Polyangia bacterium]|nr:glycosyltransferase family A protein [Polyangia bacterium]
MSHDGVSCLCLTYGRPHLLEEAIESFLRQQWSGPKELIVLNDHPDQELVFDHPEVLVVNLKRRLRTLGEKRNASAALARYDNLLIWDDDDIYLPWRIEETMKKLPSEHFYKCPNAWCIVDGRWQDKPGYNLYHGGSAYTRWLFREAGGYGCIDGGEDAAIEWRFQNVTPLKGQYWKHTILPWDRLYYIYRWGHGSYHATGHKTLDTIRPAVERGRLALAPHWKSDYREQALRRASAQPR